MDWEVVGSKQVGDMLAVGVNRTTKSFCNSSILLGLKIVAYLKNDAKYSMVARVEGASRTCHRLLWQGT